MAHFAVTDIDRGKFLSSEQYARDALGMAGAQADPFRVSLEDWSLGTPADEAGSEGSSCWTPARRGQKLRARPRDGPVRATMLNGDAGFSRKSDAEGAASYYYSIPRIERDGSSLARANPLDVQGTRVARSRVGQRRTGQPTSKAGTGSLSSSTTARL